MIGCDVTVLGLIVGKLVSRVGVPVGRADGKIRFVGAALVGAALMGAALENATGSELGEVGRLVGASLTGGVGS